MSIRDEAAIERFPQALPRPNGDLGAWAARLVDLLDRQLQNIHRSVGILADNAIDSSVGLSVSVVYSDTKPSGGEALWITQTPPIIVYAYVPAVADYLELGRVPL